VALAAGVAKAIPVVVSYGALTNTYTVTMTRAGLPAIQVSGLTDYDDSGSNAVYVSGSTTVDFGNVFSMGLHNEITMTIGNTGTADLHLTASSPYMTVSGTNSDYFTIYSPPSEAIIPKNTTTTFTVSLTMLGTGAGIKNATLTIPCDDPGGAFVIALTGQTC